MGPSAAGKTTDKTTLSIVQRDFAECLQQISLFPPGCEALKATPGVVEALDTLVEQARTEEAKDCARGALLQLTDRHMQVAVDPDAGHVMMSCAYPPTCEFGLKVTAITGSARVQINGIIKQWFSASCWNFSVVGTLSGSIVSFAAQPSYNHTLKLTRVSRAQSSG